MARKAHGLSIRAGARTHKLNFCPPVHCWAVTIVQWATETSQRWVFFCHYQLKVSLLEILSYYYNAEVSPPRRFSTLNKFYQICKILDWINYLYKNMEVDRVFTNKTCSVYCYIMFTSTLSVKKIGSIQEIRHLDKIRFKRNIYLIWYIIMLLQVVKGFLYLQMFITCLKYILNFDFSQCLI